MDKRKEANLQVKKNLYLALLELMREKPFSSITISELIGRAYVSRSSFYRNFHSLEDILRYSIDIMIQDYTRSKPTEKEDFRNYEFVLHLFRFYQKYSSSIVTVLKSNASINLLAEITDYIIHVNGDMKASSTEVYELYYYAGACHSVMMQWLETGMKESPEEMAAIFIRLTGSQEHLSM